MKTTSEELNLIWADLEAIFLDYKGVTNKVRKDLKKLGFEVYGNGHPKIRVKGQVITLCATPSDIYAGRQILRRIRKVYEHGKMSK